MEPRHPTSPEPGQFACAGQKTQLVLINVNLMKLNPNNEIYIIPEIKL